MADESPRGPQAQVFAFMQDAATHGGREVARFDTHAAVVFLAGERAYKIKRAVRFPFLDYSTLAAAQAALAASHASASPAPDGTAGCIRDKPRA